MPETQRSSLRPPLASFLPVARRWRWMLLAAALAAGVAGYVTAAGSGRAYESRADILVGSVNSGNNDDLQASAAPRRPTPSWRRRGGSSSRRRTACGSATSPATSR
jgi:uncharacterized protein involved in exopolysaccharide biosynthesis